MRPLIYTRKMNRSDLPSVYCVMNMNLQGYFEPEVMEFFLAQWPDGQFVATNITGKIIGALSGARLDGGRASISLLAVDSAYRGQGVGTALFECVRTACFMSGLGKIQLEVRIDNVPAIDFYRKKGFEITERLPSFYNDGGDGYRMTLDLYGRVSLS